MTGAPFIFGRFPFIMLSRSCAKLSCDNASRYMGNAAPSLHFWRRTEMEE